MENYIWKWYRPRSLTINLVNQACITVDVLFLTKKYVISKKEDLRTFCQDLKWHYEVWKDSKYNNATVFLGVRQKLGLILILLCFQSRAKY